MSFFPVIELVDRYTIAFLKYNKTQANKEELDFYAEKLEQYNTSAIESELQALYEIHSQIWNLEAELKSGKENDLPLDEIGRRAIAIRNLNNKRISLKNLAAEKLGCVIKEIKQDHLSQ